MPSPLLAQNDLRIDGAAAITADDVRRHIGVLAHDSMQGRDTPSPELEKTAQYLVDQFRALGLRPGGDLGPATLALRADSGLGLPWMQRYPVPGGLQASTLPTLVFTARLNRAGKNVIAEQGSLVDAVSSAVGCFVADTVPESGGVGLYSQSVNSRVLVLTGRHTPETVRHAKLNEHMVIYIPPANADSANVQSVVRQLRTRSHVVILPNEDSVTFAQRRSAASKHPPIVIPRALEGSMEPHWAIAVWSGVLSRFLGAAGLDLVQLRADSMPRVREVPSIGVMTDPLIPDSGSNRGTGVNVAAILPGADTIDTLLRNQYIVISAHMDQMGITHGQPDSIHNGADDNASGVAGLLALAKAFSQPGARPRRSILFLATSGAARGHWGINYYLENSSLGGWVAVPLSLTLDMIGRARGDSLLIDGLSDFDFASRPDWVAMQHPELGLSLVDGGSIFSEESDHVAFLRWVVPSLYVHAGNHDELAKTANPPATVDAEQEVRMLRMIYYMVQQLANGEPPRWTRTARAQRASFFGR